MSAIPREMPVWTAPLVPVALAMTGGIVLDRHAVIAMSASVSVALVSMLAWLIFSNSRHHWLALCYLLGSAAGFGAAFHHWQRYQLDADDISLFADHAGQPARLRGTLTTAPTVQLAVRAEPLRSFDSKDTTRFVLRVTQCQDVQAHVWTNAAGQVQVTLLGPATDITVGDEVELLGRLALPGEAMNVGEFDYGSFLRDQGITATLTVLTTDEVTLVRRGWPTSLFGWLAVVRGWGQRMFQRDLGSQHAVAAALLLGESSGMTGADWDQYLHTGVIHVLAISGQHLVVLAGFLWLLMRLLGIRRRQAALFVAATLFTYALLTGARPPVMRAAWAIMAYGVGTLLQRSTSRANTFALAWICVALFNPADLFNAGCQLSFLAVAALVWGVGPWFDRPADPLEQVIAETRPWILRGIGWLWRTLWISYAINALMWLAVSPLAASYFHVVSPIALVIGPPMVLLTSIALLAGFAFLLFAGWCAPLAWPFALATQVSLIGCETLVSLGQRLPGAYFYIADIPAWWLWVFYMGLLLGMVVPLLRRHAQSVMLASGGWLVLLIVLQSWPHRPGEFRCSFVAVGHGGCTVVETPGGLVSVYDAGAVTGPDVTRRHIAPFLWARGIRRIDDLIVSHADLDHFNGIAELTERFAVGRVISTPSFAGRNLAGMRETLAALERRQIGMHVVLAGDRWQTDDVSFEVLHPPAVGPAGKENVRSLVLCVRYENRSILLTGDLEEAGLARVLALPAPPLDVLMAPHHGSDRSNVPELAAWAKPRFAVSCQTAQKNERACVRMYEKLGIPFLGTWPHGTVTIRHDGEKAWVETYRTGLKKVISRRDEK